MKHNYVVIISKGDVLIMCRGSENSGRLKECENPHLPPREWTDNV